MLFRSPKTPKPLVLILIIRNVKKRGQGYRLASLDPSLGDVRDPTWSEEYPAASCCQHLKSGNALLPPGPHVVFQQLFGSNADLFGLAWYLWRPVVCEASSLPRCQSPRALHIPLRPSVLAAYPRSLHGTRLSLGKWDCK